MINYYRDWWKERTYDPDTEQIVTNDPPLNEPDDPDDRAYTQTTIQLRVETYLNSSNPVRVVSRTLARPNFGSQVPSRGGGERAVGESWYVTQIIIVQPDGSVIIGNR
jgi:hypothetical protein